MAVKAMRYEIVGWSGDPAAARKRWMAIADDCRELINTIWQEWEAWHVQHGSCEKLREDNRKYREACEAGEKPPKSKDGFPWWSSELQKVIYRKIADRFPHVHSRIKVLLLNITQQRMNGKDSEGRQKIWRAVLLNRQGRPNCTKLPPIPFDKQNSKPIELIEGKYTNYRLQIKLTRVPTDKKNALSIEDEVQLKARGSGAVIAKRICSGEYKFCGSSIVYNESRRKWFCLLAYNDNAAEIKTDEKSEKKRAILVPGRDTPWVLWNDSRFDYFGGRGSYVIAARQRLLTGRWSRQEGYRYAGSANKGHGRERAMEGVNRLSRGWKDFVKTCNHTITHQVVRYCVERGIGRLIYLQPAEAKRESRFLTTAGKIPGRVDSTGWDWSQVASLLAYKCKDVGIHFELRKCDASGRKKKPESEAKKQGRSQRRSAAVAG